SRSPAKMARKASYRLTGLGGPTRQCRGWSLFGGADGETVGLVTRVGDPDGIERCPYQGRPPTWWPCEWRHGGGQPLLVPSGCSQLLPGDGACLCLRSVELPALLPGSGV